MIAARSRGMWVLALIAGCGGSGETRPSVPDPPACTGQTDAELCEIAGAQCGSIKAKDRCGQKRTPACGSCGAHATCDSNSMVCVCETGFSGDGSLCTTAIGAACSNGDGTQQDCPNGQVCTTSQGLNLCNFPGCGTDSDCGTNGVIPNSCGATTIGLQCQLNCLPSNPNSCGNPELVCLPGSSSEASETSQCIINCNEEPDGWCLSQAYGGICQSGGLCEAQPCGPGETCDTGWVCNTVQPTPRIPEYCVPDCRISGNTCPSSAVVCDSANGICDIAAS